LKARWLQNAVRDVQSIDQQTARKIDFYTGQFVDAIAPSNFLVTNPEVLRETITYFVTMVDFADAGELSVFIDEEQLSALEERMNAKGYLEGRNMSAAFKMLRANDFIWSCVVNNYLLARSPFSFDLLYWNANSTHLPAAMHSFYLRNMYHENLLAKPGGISLDGVPIDLRKVRTRSFLLSTREDHIAPWRSTYAAPQLYRGPVKFVLSTSGTSQGSSIRREVNMATGRTKRTRRLRRSGSPQRHPSPIPGGRHGRTGSRSTQEARCRRGTQATAGSNRSRTPLAPTSRCALPADRIQRPPLAHG
jgi:poly(3-hydroxyalkanoate) synthetase